MTAETRLAQARTPGDTVTLKRKSYLRAQERQRIAEVRLEAEIDQRECAERWARDCLAEERRLRDRCEFLYGIATRHGATDDELRSLEASRPTRPLGFECQWCHCIGYHAEFCEGFNINDPARIAAPSEVANR